MKVEPPPIPISSISFNSRRKSTIKSNQSVELSQSPEKLYIPIAPLSTQIDDIKDTALLQSSPEKIKDLNHHEFDDGSAAEDADFPLYSKTSGNGNNESYSTYANNVKFVEENIPKGVDIPNFSNQPFENNARAFNESGYPGANKYDYRIRPSSSISENLSTILMQLSYTWKLTKSDLQNGKIVSVPFGPAEWAWQIILYPNGTGDASHQFMSAFLRVVKNDEENESNNWERPIKGFSLKIKKGSVPSPLSVNSSLSEEGDFLIHYSEPDFKVFTENQMGWGFHEFCRLPISEEIISDSDFLRIEAQITGNMTGKITSLYHEEKLAIGLILNNQIVSSSSFGPPESEFLAEFASLPDSNGNFNSISAHLRALLPHASNRRKMATFDMKLLHPSNREVLCSKCLTGGFTYSIYTPISGWDDFLTADAFLNLKLEYVILQICISWDPHQFSRYITPLSDSNINQISESSTKKYDLALEEIQELRKRIHLLNFELATSRTSENELHVSQVRFSTMKEKLSKLRLSLENDFCLTDNMNEDSNRELASCKLQLANLFHEKAQVDLKLSQALSELQFINRSSRDSLLLAPIPSFEEQNLIEVDPIEKISLAIETARNEALIGKAALEEFKSKTANRIISNLSNLDRSGLIADISMVQCGLDVANATLAEAAENLHILGDVSEFLHVQKDLQEVRMNFSSARASLDENHSRSMLSHASSIDSQGFSGTVISPANGIISPIFPPPIVPSLIPKNRGKRSSNPHFSELEQQSSLKAISVRIESLSEMLKTGAVGTSLLSATRSFRPSDIEPWTPKEGSSGLDHNQLQNLLKDLKQKKRNSFFSFMFFGSFFTFFFGIYSLIFIICGSQSQSSTFSEFSPLCYDVVLPIWNQSHSFWHKTSEIIIVDLLPDYLNRTKYGISKIRRMTIESILTTLDRAIKQGSDFQVTRENHDPIHPAVPDAPKTSNLKIESLERLKNEELSISRKQVSVEKYELNSDNVEVAIEIFPSTTINESTASFTILKESTLSESTTDSTSDPTSNVAATILNHINDVKVSRKSSSIKVREKSDALSSIKVTETSYVSPSIEVEKTSDASSSIIVEKTSDATPPNEVEETSDAPPSNEVEETSHALPSMKDNSSNSIPSSTSFEVSSSESKNEDESLIICASFLSTKMLSTSSTPTPIQVSMSMTHRKDTQGSNSPQFPYSVASPSTSILSVDEIDPKITLPSFSSATVTDESAEFMDNVTSEKSSTTEQSLLRFEIKTSAETELTRTSISISSSVSGSSMSDNDANLMNDFGDVDSDKEESVPASDYKTNIKYAEDEFTQTPASVASSVIDANEAYIEEEIVHADIESPEDDILKTEKENPSVAPISESDHISLVENTHKE